MFGHIAGSAAQVAIVALCKSIDANAALCSAAGIFVHEIIVEPVIDSIAKYGLSSLYHWKLVTPDILNPRFIAGVFGSILAGKVFHNFAHYHYHSGCSVEHHSSQHGHGWGGLMIEGIFSMAGSLAGETVYSAFMKTFFPEYVHDHDHSHSHDHSHGHFDNYGPTYVQPIDYDNYDNYDDSDYYGYSDDRDNDNQHHEESQELVSKSQESLSHKHIIL